jgi:chromosome segregation ATPase
MKKLSFSIILGFLAIVFIISPSFAIGGLGLGTIRVGTNSARENAIHPIQTQAFDNLKQRADTEIQRRVTSLTELITKINSLKKLSATDKSGFANQIQAQIDSLNTLKTKINADTDLATLRTDVQSIILSYRIYVVYLPQTRMLIAADSMGTTADNLTTLSIKLQTLITASGATGDTLTNLQGLLTDMETNIKNANDSYQSVETEILALTPQGYPGNRTTLMDARAKLKTGLTDIKTARDDAKKIVKILRSLNKPLNATGSSILGK